jgi:hypothetical protein
MEESGQPQVPAVSHPGKEPPDTYQTESWVGLKARLKAVEKRKISCPCHESNPDSLTVQSVV